MHAELQHGDSDERLEAIAKQLHGLKAVELLQDSMPFECEMLKHYKALFT